MKKLALVLSAAAAFALAAPAQAKIDSATEARLIEVCKALKSNSKLKLHKVMKRNRLRYSEVAEGLVCNGQDAISFALLHSANETATLVAKRANVDIDAMLAKR